jgi:glycolate oxidase
MALSKDAYRELEDILGPENISQDEAMLDIYSFQSMGELRGPDPKWRFWTSPEAVTLPGSTEEVQAIVRLCNRRGIKYKAISTGYGPHNAVSAEGTIHMDLRRMNRILDIDEKNMTILVEPYVSFIQVQAEAMKRGLNTHIIGAGAQPSYLASLTSVIGANKMAISQGSSARNMLGVEWVSPTGEIIGLGSPGSGAGWFSGDGPGPSLRGIIRGASGAQGGLGVFTKCAGHLHPWPGPETIEVKGVAPYYEAVMPPNFVYHVIEWPSWDKCSDAQLKMGEADIAYVVHKTSGPGSHGSIVSGSNNEYYEMQKDGSMKIPANAQAIVMAARTPEEHAYQSRTLDKILEETGGKIVPLGEEPYFRDRDFLNMIRACFIPRLAFRLSGNFSVDGFVGMESIDSCSMGLDMDEAHRDKYAEKGIIMDDGTYNSWGVAWEGSHYGHFECGHIYNPLDAESASGMAEMIIEGAEVSFKTPFNLSWAPWALIIAADIDKIGSECCNFQDWLRRIKNTFDPESASDSGQYISPDKK